MTDKEKILEFLADKGESVSDFYRKTGLSNNFLKQGKSLGVDKLRLIIEKYPDFNLNRLFPMNIYLSSPGEASTVEEGRIPYGAIPYYNLVVSAGKSITDIEGTIKPDGYIKDLPGASYTEAFLPVRGYSMFPEIKEGAIIGVRKASRIDHLNTQHKYLIITKDDRMVKYISHDKERDDIIWCISPNFPDFSILKEDIVEMHRVTFVMNPE